MNDLLNNLVKLQALEFDETGAQNTQALVAELRSLIPVPILSHYDRLRARGKKGITSVRNQVCSGCHMRLPIGTINTLMHGTDIQLCETCGRYLYLEETPAAVAPEASVAETVVEAPVKKTSKARKRKAVANAV